MLTLYSAGPHGLRRIEPAGPDTFAGALWLDLLEPAPEEEKRVEQALDIDVPTREEMREIEASNRLYEESGVLYMTATVVTKLDADLPETAQVTFILNGSQLVTNRYVDPLPFRRFVAHAQTHPAACTSAVALLIGLLEAIVNRIADVLERIGSDMDTLSTQVFGSAGRRRAAPRDYREVLGRVGQSGEMLSKARESLVSLGRLLVFVQQSGNDRINQDARAKFRTLSRDVIAMSDHASFLNGKVSFVLDATLGMVTIDQNNIMKIFSFVTVFLLPPSVIGAFYGMNFPHIPWLQASWGHWAALAMMLVSSFIPYLIFKRRGWL